MFETKKDRIERDRKVEAGPDYEAMAAKAAPDAIAKFPDLMASFRASHRKDLLSYSFECRRFGDFLSVFIQRGGDKHASTINLGRSRAIEFREGGAPDRAGEIRFYVTTLSDQPDAETGRSYSDGVLASLPREPFRTAIYVEPEPGVQSGNAGGAGFSQRVMAMVGGSGIVHRIPDAPRPARDDTIVFMGARTTVYVPAGRGREVYELILAALGSQRARGRSAEHRVGPRRLQSPDVSEPGEEVRERS